MSKQVKPSPLEREGASRSEAGEGRPASAHAYDEARIRFIEAWGFHSPRFWNNHMLGLPAETANAEARA
jgi:hypothetical protein